MVNANVELAEESKLSSVVCYLEVVKQRKLMKYPSFIINFWNNGYASVGCWFQS